MLHRPEYQLVVLFMFLPFVLAIGVSPPTLAGWIGWFVGAMLMGGLVWFVAVALAAWPFDRHQKG